MISMEITYSKSVFISLPIEQRLQELSIIKKLLLKNKAIERFAPFWKITSSVFKLHILI